MYECSYVVSVGISECGSVVAAIFDTISVAQCISVSIAIDASDSVTQHSAICESFVDSIAVAQCVSIAYALVTSISGSIGDSVLVAQCIAFRLPFSASIVYANRATNGITVIDAIDASHELTYDIQSNRTTYNRPHAVSIRVAIGASDDVSIGGDVSGQYNVRSGGGDRGE